MCFPCLITIGVSEQGFIFFHSYVICALSSALRMISVRLGVFVCLVLFVLHSILMGRAGRYLERGVLSFDDNLRAGLGLGREGAILWLHYQLYSSLQFLHIY